jgi:glutamate/tyrosine decarboxylase-like PLP-dependent enzyme
MDRDRGALGAAAEAAARFLDGVEERRVWPEMGEDELRERLSLPLADEGVDPAVVVSDLASGAEPGIVATAGPRYFGFVIGGSLPAALGTDWLVSAWDQFGAGGPVSPAMTVVEEVAARWSLELFGLPSECSVGFVTGGQGANTTCLAAARHAVLRRVGWDVEHDGLAAAPPVRIILGAEAHVTIFRALRLLGFGADTAVKVAADDQGRMEPAELEAVLGSGSGPTIVCAQAGNVNSGAFDPLDEIASLCSAAGAWLHVDGAFGLWAAASPQLRGLVRGVERADSWAVDAPKWLNVPYDCALAIVRDREAHFASMDLSAPYLQERRTDWSGPLVPESSRRPRGATVYAAIRSLGRRGVADLIERCCGHAHLMADRLAAEDGVEVLNDVVLNQVLVRFADDDVLTRAVVDEVQREGTCWLGGTTWHGRGAMRISFSNWSTVDADVERSAVAILSAFAAVSAQTAAG